MLQSLEQFITILNSNKRLINYLFENRKINVSLESIEDSYSQELQKLNFLVENSILNQNADNISLDITLLEFFEDFLNISEQINTAYISDTVRRLESNIDYYTEEKGEKNQEKYVSEIKRDMKGISRNIKKEIIALQRNIDNVYKTEQNFNIKKKKLEDYKQKRDDIINLKESIERLLDNKRIILENISDLELSSIINNLHKILNECYTFLIQIQQELIVYINKARIYGEIFRKLQKLKYLKDHQEIKQKTNITKVIKQEQGLPLQPRKTLYTKISLDYLQTDEGFAAIKKLAGKNKKKAKVFLPSQELIPEDSFAKQVQQEDNIELEIIWKAFNNSEHDLFIFIINYDFGYNFSLEQRINLFCEMVSEYESDLIFGEKLGDFERFNYAMVYPGKNR